MEKGEVWGGGRDVVEHLDDGHPVAVVRLRLRLHRDEGRVDRVRDGHARDDEARAEEPLEQEHDEGGRGEDDVELWHPVRSRRTTSTATRTNM